MFKHNKVLNNAALMIDLETGATPETADNPSVFSIGALMFDPHAKVQNSESLKKHSFYRNIDRESCKAVGMEECKQTMDWWETQPEAWKELSTNPTHIADAIYDLLQWIREFDPTVTSIWANSPSFDLYVIKRACKLVGRRWTLPFYIEFDVRTLRRLGWDTMDEMPVIDNPGLAHNALDDCVKQAQHVQLAWAKIRGLI